MKTLNTKVLPMLRVLINNCNEHEEKKLILMSPCGQHRLVFEKNMFKQNINFDFFQVTDGKFLLIQIAVLKSNPDSIVPFKYLYDDKLEDLWVTMVDFLPDGSMTYRTHSDKLLQRTFTLWMDTWFELININHKIAV